MQSLFLSDLHLSEQTPEISSYFRQFIDYCQENIKQIDNIYILGDFFEFWVGDDYQSPFSDQIFQQLRSISQHSHIQCYFMHGNRDFLLQQGFSDKTGFTHIEDPYSIYLDGQKTILSHGDILCTDDVPYQKMRQLFRSKAWQDEMLAKSISERIEIAIAARKQSENLKQQNKDTKMHQEISDVNTDSVKNLLRQKQSTTLIHGHTHRPQTHTFDLDGNGGAKRAKRIVLAAWYKKGSFLKYENKTFSTIELSS